MKKLLIASIIFGAAQVMAVGSTVIAKYGNWYKGDDDLYAQCLIVSDGHNAKVQYIYQGLSAVTVSQKTVAADQLKKLEGTRANLGCDSTLSSYYGYNFLAVTDTKGAVDSTLEVLGLAPGVKGNTTYDQYFSVNRESAAGKAVIAICDMEAKD